MEESPGSNSEENFLKDINPNSLETLYAKAEPSIVSSKKGQSFQFQRKGYFALDTKTKANKIVFNKTVGLRDSWKK